MSRTVTTSDTLTVYLSGYIDKTVDGDWYSMSTPEGAYGATSKDNNACFIGCVRSAEAETWMYFTFDTSAIPQNAIIDSVSCVARVYQSGGSYLATREYQLFSGTSAKGSPYTDFGGTTKVITLDTGTWTRSDLEDARLRYYAKRLTTSYNQGAITRLYGSNLTVNYSVTEIYYEVTTSSNSSSISFSPSSDEYVSGSTTTITISGDLSNAVVTDNGVDVTNLISGSGTTHTYTVANISADHSIVVTVLGPDVYFKQNDSWVKADKVFVKINGAWVEASDIKVKANGTWQ